MSAGPFVRMVIRKYFSLSLLIIGLLYSTISALSRSTYSESLVYKFLNLQNDLSPLITPHEVFDEYTISKKNALTTISNSIYNKLSNPELANSLWRFTKGLINHKLDENIDSRYIEQYLQKRQTEHFYDPRITLPVYLKALNLAYTEGSNKIPFSWEDWTDLSYLNEFLNDDKKISCADFMSNFDIKTKYEIDPTLKSSSYLNQTFCLDNEEYLKTNDGKFRDNKLLPGFNFHQRIDEKSNFIGQIYNAKSYLLSYAPPPTFIYFLNDKGTYYKASPVQSTNMIDNGMLENFKNTDSFSGFDPIKEQKSMNTNYISHNKNDFAVLLKKNKNFQYEVPETKFDLNYSETFPHIFTNNAQDLSTHELLFKESIEYSDSILEENLHKYFKEINIIFPATYSGHKLTESGAHYDSRFFSGLLTEMPKSKYTPRSPHYEKPQTDVSSSDSTVKRRSVILSNMIHTILTTTFHEGLVMIPAHGSLLAWYFNSGTFPWDTDADVQMPIEDLATFCLNFNNSMIVQNPRYGTSKLYVDCTDSLTHRVKGNGNNNIDARIIDVDSGVFIDITGLSLTHDRISKGYLNNIKSWLPNVDVNTYPHAKKVLSTVGRTIRQKPVYKPKTPAEIEKDNIAYEIHKENRLYNCRNDHYYTYEQLSPLRLTLFEGAPTFVSSESKAYKFMLGIEYKKTSLSKPVHDMYVFIKELALWVHADDIYYALLNNGIQINSKMKQSALRRRKNVKGATVFEPYRRNKAIVVSELVNNSLFEITGETSFHSENYRDPMLNIIEEVYHDRVYTAAHQKEMALFDYSWQWKVPSINSQVDISSDWKRLGQWMLEDHPPKKMSYFDYLISTEKEDKEKLEITKTEDDSNEDV